MTDKGNSLELEIIVEPGYRLELLAGVLVWDPPADLPHQRCARKLQRILEEYFQQIDPKGELLSSMCIGLENSVMLPDLVYISGQQREMLLQTHIPGAPTLVAEIVSPYTREKDSILKFNIYESAQVQHYWLLDYKGQGLKCFALAKEGYALVAQGKNEDIMLHPDFAGLSIDLRALWPYCSGKDSIKP